MTMTTRGILPRPIGRKENFYVHDGYRVRLDNYAFDDTPYKDEWQNEIYAYANRMFRFNNMASILDAGCGSGYKLIKYFADVKTLGLELEPTLTWLKAQYPDKAWGLAGSVPPWGPYNPDMVISADVIEHIPNPTPYLEYIVSMKPRLVVFSTPERDLLNLGTEDGPPKNAHHVREWNLNQFVMYLSDYFFIEEAFAFPTKSTCVLCRPRA